jgi:hypothetical protein
MRSMLPLALALATLGACGQVPDRREETASRTPARDLTLQPAEQPAATVASPVELDRTRPRPTAKPTFHRAAQRSRPAPAARPVPVADVPVALTVPARAPLALPATMTATAVAASDPHALEPGQTVTVLPASGGAPSPVGPGARTDERPADARGGTDVQIGGDGGGSCGGRGGGHHPGGFRGLR